MEIDSTEQRNQALRELVDRAARHDRVANMLGTVAQTLIDSGMDPHEVAFEFREAAKQVGSYS